MSSIEECETENMLVKVNGKVIGKLEGDVFSKVVKGSKHLFRKLNAWGVDAEFFTEHLVSTNKTIVVHDSENGITYQTNATSMREHGQYYHFKKGKDHRAQIFLPLALWSTKK